MATTTIKPFQNEADCVQIGDFTIENRLDRVSLFGSIDITKDKEGLRRAKELKLIVDLTISELEKSELPDKITLIPVETVVNPFT